MTKLTHPLLSLHAQGTIGDAITHQRAGSPHIARRKPILPYFSTLPTSYQRWLYRDYAHRWTLQSATTKATYRASSGRFNLTAYQYWMKVMLSTLPDIIFWWKLDIAHGPTTPDAGHGNHPGTLLGPVPGSGIIGPAVNLDGLNDTVRITALDWSLMGTEYTWDFWLYPRKINARHYPLGSTPWVAGIAFLRMEPTGKLTYSSHGGTDCDAATPLLLNTWQHIAVRYTGGTYSQYRDGVLDSPLKPGTPLTGSHDFYVGRGHGAEHWEGLVDNFRAYNRALAPSEIARHATQQRPSD